jgi:putative heme iron utilization protein
MRHSRDCIRATRDDGVWTLGERDRVLGVHLSGPAPSREFPGILPGLPGKATSRCETQGPAMNRHTGPQETPSAPPPPEPTYAERARTLMMRERTGTLSTLSRRHPGHPFGSLMPYAVDESGRPLFLISTLAMHTRNLEQDPRASLFVAESAASEDPLAVGRVTLMGTAGRVPSGEVAGARASYLARHPNASNWVDFEDFSFWRLEILDVYWVGGFGAMDWLTIRDYAAARPDPLADAAAGIMEHMNRDHPDALLMMARVLGREAADEARMTNVDRLGFGLRLRSGGRFRGCRIPFPREVTSAPLCREVLIEMLRECKSRG